MLGLGADEQISEDEARKRREQLNRRPSYRMILKDLETADKNLKKEPEDTPPASNEPPPQLQLHVQIPSAARLPGPSASPYGSPLGSSLLPPPATTALSHPLGFPLNGDLQQPIHLGDYNSAAIAAAVVAASQNRQLTPTSSQHELPSQGTPSGSTGLLLPGAELHGLKPPSMGEIPTNPFANHVGGQIVDWQQQLLSGYNSSPSPSGMGRGLGGCEDESTRKRQVRLLKNREAAKECRRKKKEYVKCLENRVAVLENQNKALIEELKTLKELYCRKEKQESL
ncbi:unnamed protein product, partial [Mesorhabditis spiculigera]